MPGRFCPDDISLTVIFLVELNDFNLKIRESGNETAPVAKPTAWLDQPSNLQVTRKGSDRLLHCCGKMKFHVIMKIPRSVYREKNQNS
jgi:hypothetical protein